MLLQSDYKAIKTCLKHVHPSIFIFGLFNLYDCYSYRHNAIADDKSVDNHFTNNIIIAHLFLWHNCFHIFFSFLFLSIYSCRLHLTAVATKLMYDYFRFQAETSARSIYVVATMENSVYNHT